MHGASSMKFSTNLLPIYSYTINALFDGLLAELPAILDSFFHQYHKLLHSGGWSGVLGATKWWEKHAV